MNNSLGLRFILMAMLISTSMRAEMAVGQTATDEIQFVAPRIAHDPGEPGGRGRGGAGRGPCKQYESLTALVPAVKTGTTEQVSGLTTSDRPTFWFSIPVALAPQTPIKLTLQDQDENTIYQTTLAPSSSAGIIQMTLPPIAAPLQVNHTYRWGFSVQCDASDPTASIFVRGSIRRVALPKEIESQLVDKSAIDRAILYANQGIWFDALTTLGQAICPTKTSEDPAVMEAWATLLKQGNLADVVKAPIVPCCTLK